MEYEGKAYLYDEKKKLAEPFPEVCDFVRASQAVWRAGLGVGERRIQLVRRKKMRVVRRQLAHT